MPTLERTWPDPKKLALMRALRAKGMSFHGIAAKLNQQGLAAPRGGRWYATSVRTILNGPDKAATKSKALPQAVESPDKALFDAWHATLNNNTNQEMSC